MIAGVDGKGEPYLCYPQRGKGRSAPFGPSVEMKTLDEAIVLDDVLGREALVAVFCPEPFEYQTVAQALRKVATPAEQRAIINAKGCRERIVQLKTTKPESQ